ncbi:MAG: hypothetical protein L6Q35_11855, partial [Phycisphaerales bacterium]|nr:hypothetical protein [Phycisphaerales bacterium]
MVAWTGNAGDNLWHTGANWSSGVVPTIDDDVTIPDVTGTPTIRFTAATGTRAVKSLVSHEAVLLSGGTLNVATTWHMAASATLGGGVISGGTVSSSDGSMLVLSRDWGRLIGVTIAAGTVVDGTRRASNYPYNPGVDVTGGLTLNGTLLLGAADGSSSGRVNFLGTQTLGGTGVVVFGGSADNMLVESATSGTLTIGAQVTVQGGSGYIGGTNSFGTTENVLFYGTLNIPAGRSIAIDGDGWVNHGVMNVEGASVSLRGSFATASLGVFNATGATVLLQGTLQNTAATLTLQSSLGGSWWLSGGWINGGTVSSSDGSMLVLSRDWGRLIGVTIAAGTVVDGTRRA